MNRVEESRQKVKARLVEIGEAADREVEKARRIKSAAIAVFGVVGALLAVRRLVRTIQPKGGDPGRPKRSGPAA